MRGRAPRTHRRAARRALSPGRAAVRRRALTGVVGLVAAPWLAWAVLRGFGLDHGYPLAALAAFTPYAAMSSVVPVVLAALLRRRLLAAVSLAAAVVLVSAIAPRVLDGPRPGRMPTGPRLVVMTVNVYGGAADARAIVRLVREHRVDVLSLQELTPEAVARLDAAGADEVLPGRAVDARPNAAGSGLMTRGPLEPEGARAPRGLSAQPAATLRVPGAPALALMAVHPLPPVDGSAAAGWRRRLEALPRAGTGGRLRVLAGDFNATLDHSAFRDLLGDDGYTDAADAVGAGLRPTWPVGRSTPGITIDHVLVDPRIRVDAVKIRGVRGTDHRAVIATLILPG